MGLFAALSAGVSGLDSQSNKIGIISNNIANVNTVGYKQAQAAFDTLVVPSGTTSFSPGGVIGDTQQLVNVQGTISASTSDTDVAISGAGFFVVNSNDTGSGNTYYTRSGSFTQDSNGDFINSDGYYLMGLPINSDGQTAEPNAQNLNVVSVSQSATGAATGTSNVSVVANLDASQAVLPGSSAIATMAAANNTSKANVGATGDQIIVGDDYGATSDTTNDLKRGDTMNVVSNGTITDTFTYGGFTVGRDITAGTDGDGGNTLVTDTPNAGFSTFDATSFGTETGDIDAATPVLTLDSTAFTDGTVSPGNTTFTIGGQTINIIAGTTNTNNIQDTGSTTLAAVASYLNSISNTALGSPYTGLTFAANAAGTTLYAVNTTAAQITGASSAYSNAVPIGDAGSAGSSVAASGTADILSLAANANLAVGNTITINGQAITVVASGATGSNEVDIGANNAATLNSLTTLLNANAATFGLSNFTISNNGSGTNAADLIATNNDAVNAHNVPAVTPAAGTPTTATPSTNATNLPASSTIGSFTDGPIVAGDSITVQGVQFNFVAAGGSGTSVNVGATLGDTLSALVTAMNTNTTLNQTDGLTFSSSSPSDDSGFLYAQDNQGVGTTAIDTSYTKATNIANTTYSAITGLNVSSTTASAVGGAGQLAAETLIVDGQTITLSATESLSGIASQLQTQLRLVSGGSASTVTVTGSANNYSLLVQDTSGAGLSGFDDTNSKAISGASSSATFSVVPPDSTPQASQLSIAVNSAGDYTLGQYVNISGVTSSIGGIDPIAVNGELKVVGVDVNNNTIIVATSGAAAEAVSNVSGGSDAIVTNRSYNFTGNILNATSATDDFLTTGATPLTSADFASDAAHFTISVNGGTPQVFGYSTTPDPSEGTFNNLNTLAEAISDGQGLTATVAGGRLYVSATDANDSVTFTNGDAVGNGTLPGINWTQELDLQNIPATTGTNLFNSLQGLANEVNAVDPTNLTASVTNPDAASSLTITEANPEQTISFSDGQAGGSILKELGFNNTSPDTTVGSGAYTTGTLGITYSPTQETKDMSSGAVTPQFSHDITIYDAQGNSHTLAMNFVKLATNEWGVELTAVPASDVTSTTNDGQLANGTITFNGEGQIASVSGTIASTVAINWKNGASPSQILLNFGLGSTSTANGTADLSQSAGAFNVSEVNQNGSPTGELTGVSIDENGYVIANFSNGQTQKLYQLPLASVNNPDGLEAVSGNAYQQTLASGIANLQLAGTSGVGTFSPSALEQSNVDLSTQLTDLIVAQQAYGANSKLLTVADTLLQELDQIIQ